MTCGFPFFVREPGKVITEQSSLSSAHSRRAISLRRAPVKSNIFTSAANGSPTSAAAVQNHRSSSARRTSARKFRLGLGLPVEEGGRRRASGFAANARRRCCAAHLKRAPRASPIFRPRLSLAAPLRAAHAGDALPDQFGDHGVNVVAGDLADGSLSPPMSQAALH